MIATTEGGKGSWSIVKAFKVDANNIETGSTFSSREINNLLKLLIFAQIIKA